MTQQINLYSEILRHQQQRSGIKFAAKLLSALLGLFALISLYLWWQTMSTASELKQAQQLFEQQQNQLSGLMAKHSATQPNTQLISEIEHWQKNVNEAAQTLQMLTSKQVILSKGFSYYLKALALQPNPEVWLTAIHIDGKDRELKLEGSTFKPEQIPLTLQQFQSKPALKGQTFAKLNMSQSAKIPGQIDFVLSSSDKPSDENKDAR